MICWEDQVQTREGRANPDARMQANEETIQARTGQSRETQDRDRDMGDGGKKDQEISWLDVR